MAGASLDNKKTAEPLGIRQSLDGAVDEIRTRDIHLGKVVLYQLSYNRISDIFFPRRFRFGSPCCCGENIT